MFVCLSYSRFGPTWSVSACDRCECPVPVNWHGALSTPASGSDPVGVAPGHCHCVLGICSALSWITVLSHRSNIRYFKGLHRRIAQSSLYVTHISIYRSGGGSFTVAHTYAALGLWYATFRESSLCLPSSGSRTPS